MENVYGSIGEQPTYSELPFIQSLLEKEPCKVIPVREDDMRSLLMNGILQGVYVHSPFTKEAKQYCTVLSEAAARTGQVTALTLNMDQQIEGHNTDYEGIAYLMQKNRVEPRNKKVAIVGNDGTALTVARYMHDCGAQRVELVAPIDNTPCRVSTDIQIIVNASGIGGYPNNGLTPVSCEELDACECIIDLISNPLKTKLLWEAQCKGIRAINGLDMELAKACHIVELFHKKSVPDEVVQHAREEIRRQTANINLIGMPGSGKTTIGKMVAEKLGRRFFDIDLEIIRTTGMTPGDIITQQGEAKFRAIETEVLAEISKEKGVVIATGGGVVTQHANRSLLEQNGETVFILRDLEKLAVDGRPISKMIPAQELFKRRLPLYDSWSSIKVVNETLDEVTETINQFYWKEMGKHK